MDETHAQKSTPSLKVRVVTTILKKEKTLAEICREHNLSESDVSEWISEFLDAWR